MGVAGNMAHLLNHSCAPNCVSRNHTIMDPASGESRDHVIIFALRDISPAEELTYDYRWALCRQADASLIVFPGHLKEAGGGCSHGLLPSHAGALAEHYNRGSAQGACQACTSTAVASNACDECGLAFCDRRERVALT